MREFPTPVSRAPLCFLTSHYRRFTVSQINPYFKMRYAPNASAAGLVSAECHVVMYLIYHSSHLQMLKLRHLPIKKISACGKLLRGKLTSTVNLPATKMLSVQQEFSRKLFQGRAPILLWKSASFFQQRHAEPVSSRQVHHFVGCVQLCMF
jgi:hypothetical protein